MSEPQLERSVLEAKEREELFAIASALGTNPTAKARKADLVGQILRATGVEDAGASPPPTRARRTRAAAPAAPAADAGGPPAGETDPTAGVMGTAPDAATVPAAGGLERADDPGAGPPAGRDDAGPPVRRSRTGRGTLRQDARREDPAGPAARDAGDGSPAGLHGDGRRTAGQDSPGQDGGRGAGPAATAGGPGTAGPGTGGEGPSGPGTDAPGSAARGDEGPPRGDESGNRRSRRRRGRDRNERAERDLAGQVTDQPFTGEPTPVDGYVDLREEGYGFLRAEGHLPGPDDIYVSISQVRRFGLRRGDHLEGASRPAGGNEKYPALLRVDRVSGLEPEAARQRPWFESLIPVFPDRPLPVSGGERTSATARLVDLVAPIGFGQRVLVAAPPRSGRRTFVRDLVAGIETANPDVEVIVVVIDERPEEIAELRRSVGAEVVGTSFDRPADEHVTVTELVLERARRKVEVGADVVLVFDGLTRLARAYNLAQPATGRALAGGIDTGALNPPKRVFGAARNIGGGGSLTVIATALTETGSRMDEVIFDELRDTANAELRLSQQAAAERLFPAVDLDASTTRHEERLVDADRLGRLLALRMSLRDPGTGTAGVAGLERLLERIHATAGNDEVLAGP